MEQLAIGWHGSHDGGATAQWNAFFSTQLQTHGVQLRGRRAIVSGNPSRARSRSWSTQATGAQGLPRSNDDEEVPQHDMPCFPSSSPWHRCRCPCPARWVPRTSWPRTSLQLSHCKFNRIASIESARVSFAQTIAVCLSALAMRIGGRVHVWTPPKQWQVLYPDTSKRAAMTCTGDVCSDDAALGTWHNQGWK